MLNNLEEQAWIARCKLLGDERAFGKLVDRYKDRILRFFLMQTGGRQDLSDDLAQETFIRVWQRIGTIRQFSTFSTWLWRIAYNIWIDHRRTEKSMISTDMHPRLCEGSSLRYADDDICRTDCRQLIMQALDHLNEAERTCILLYYLQELSLKEIAAVTRYNDSSIRSHLHRGRIKLKQFTFLKEILYDEI